MMATSAQGLPTEIPLPATDCWADNGAVGLRHKNRKRGLPPTGSRGRGRAGPAGQVAELGARA